MPEVSDATTLPVGERYKENDEFVPNPTDVFGTLDTSATAGAADSAIETVTPIHEVSKAQDRLQAARALDPEDTDVPESTVVLPGDMRTREDAIEAVKRAAEADPVEIGGLTPFQKQAAEATGEEGAEVAQEQQQTQGAGSTAGTTDTSRQTGGPSASSSTAKGDAKK